MGTPDPVGRQAGLAAGRTASHPAHAVRAHGHHGARGDAPAHHAGSGQDAAQAPPAVAEHPLHPPGRVHARGGARLPAAGRRGHPSRFADGAAEGRQRQRAGDARSAAPAADDARPALLPVPVRSHLGLGPLPHHGPGGAGAHPRPAGAYDGLRPADLRHRRSRRRRQDPAAARLDPRAATATTCLLRKLHGLGAPLPGPPARKGGGAHADRPDLRPAGRIPGDGLREEETAEFDRISTIEALEGALQRLGPRDRPDRPRARPGRQAGGGRPLGPGLQHRRGPVAGSAARPRCPRSSTCTASPTPSATPW